MTPPHPTLEQMAKLLAGKMEYDELAFEVLPHLVAQCEVCAARVAEIRRLQGQVGHWNEMVAVFESQEAPALVERLSGLPLEAQLAQAETEESLQGWGVCDLLLRKCRAAVCGEPQQAVELATLAVRVAAHLSEAYDPEWVLDLPTGCSAICGARRRRFSRRRASSARAFRATRRRKRRF